VGASPEALFAAAFAPFASRLQLTSFASEDLTRMAADLAAFILPTRFRTRRHSRPRAGLCSP
jgi:hypothetical protein